MSLTYLLHSPGDLVAVLMALVSNSSTNRLATIGLTGDPMVSSMHLVIILTLEQEMGV